MSYYRVEMKSNRFWNSSITRSKVTYCLKQNQEFTTQAPVVRRLDNAIHWIRLDNTIRFDITYPPDSDLSVA